MTDTTMPRVVMDAGECRIRSEDGCALFFGAIPLNQMAAITMRCRAGDVMSADLAYLAGATMAFGSPQDVDALVAKYRAAKLAEADRHPALSSLSHGAQEWYLAG